MSIWPATSPKPSVAATRCHSEWAWYAAPEMGSAPNCSAKTSTSHLPRGVGDWPLRRCQSSTLTTSPRRSVAASSATVAVCSKRGECVWALRREHDTGSPSTDTVQNVCSSSVALEQQRPFFFGRVKSARPRQL